MKLWPTKIYLSPITWHPSQHFLWAHLTAICRSQKCSHLENKRNYQQFVFRNFPPKYSIWRHQMKQVENSQLEQAQWIHTTHPKDFPHPSDSCNVAFVTIATLWVDWRQFAQLTTSGTSTSLQQGCELENPNTSPIKTQHTMRDIGFFLEITEQKWYIEIIYIWNKYADTTLLRRPILPPMGNLTN